MDGLPVHQDLTACGIHNTGNRSKGGRFSRPIGADDPHERSIGNGQTDALDGVDTSVMGVHILELNHDGTLRRDRP